MASKMNARRKLNILAALFTRLLALALIVGLCFCLVLAASALMELVNEQRFGPQFKSNPSPFGADGKPLADTAGGKQTAAPLTGLVFVLDPGHGGDDEGEIYTTPENVDYTEAGVTLAVAQELASLLEEKGADVIMTRSAAAAGDAVGGSTEAAGEDTEAAGDTAAGDDAPADENPEAADAADSAADASGSDAAAAPLDDGLTGELTAEARAATANAQNTTFFLSLHCTPIDEDDESQPQTLIYFAKHPYANETASVLDAAGTAIAASGEPTPAVRAITGGTAPYLTRNVDAPSAVWELGSLSDADSVARLSDSAWQHKLAGALCSALVSFYGADNAE